MSFWADSHLESSQLHQARLAKQLEVDAKERSEYCRSDQIRSNFMERICLRQNTAYRIWTAAEMSRRRLEKGLRLNYPEAAALICDEILERAREGSIPMLTDMMEYGATILQKKHVMDGVADMMKILQVEAQFPDGTKLVTVMSPIRS